MHFVFGQTARPNASPLQDEFSNSSSTALVPTLCVETDFFPTIIVS
jgi:hypothetical protein